jgi:hypothetical protein
MSDGGPYREEARLVKRVCTLCFGSYSFEPKECGRCRVVRTPVDEPEAYAAMLAEARERVEVSRFKIDPLLQGRAHKAPPEGRTLEDLSVDELIDWLGMEHQR